MLSRRVGACVRQPFLMLHCRSVRDGKAARLDTFPARSYAFKPTACSASALGQMQDTTGREGSKSPEQVAEESGDVKRALAV